MGSLSKATYVLLAEIIPFKHILTARQDGVVVVLNAGGIYSLEIYNVVAYMYNILLFMRINSFTFVVKNMKSIN